MFWGSKIPSIASPRARNRPQGPRNEVPEPSRTIPGSAKIQQANKKGVETSGTTSFVDVQAKVSLEPPCVSVAPTYPRALRHLFEHTRVSLESPKFLDRLCQVICFGLCWFPEASGRLLCFVLVPGGQRMALEDLPKASKQREWAPKTRLAGPACAGQARRPELD